MKVKRIRKRPRNIHTAIAQLALFNRQIFAELRRACLLRDSLSRQAIAMHASYPQQSLLIVIAQILYFNAWGKLIILPDFACLGSAINELATEKIAQTLALSL